MSTRHADKLPPAARAAIILSLSIALWTMIFVLAFYVKALL